MTVTFFDSFSELLNNKTLRVPIFNLWEERELMYKVYPKTESATLWIYIKAPNNFHITSDEQIKNDQLPIVRDSEPDPEIATHRIVPKSLHGNQHPMFKINITIPKTLKVWLTTIIAISYITIIWVTICLFDKINLFSKIGIFPLTITNDFFSKNTSQEPLLSAILAMVAFILTARSWLIHEETVLAPISKKFSFLSLIFILLIIIVVIFFASY
jgi:hypothetical protein